MCDEFKGGARGVEGRGGGATNPDSSKTFIAIGICEEFAPCDSLS